ncbi:MAG: PleD family two-component system response regulator [Nitrospirae bacterium YQR-1]
MEQKRPTILIVDDEKNNIDVLVNLLSGKYRIVIAKSGEQALKRLNQIDNDIDLILLDVLMPEMDGYEVCRRIKKNIDTNGIPVIFITALSETENETTGFEAGAVDYITKPFSPPVVVARVRTHLELKLYRDTCEAMAWEDGLTGIPNRRKFEEFFGFQWNATGRRRAPLSLILMDVDFFKRYNDNYGHGAGDECLKSVACALKSAMPRTSDIVARYGGEEFVCVLPDTDSAGGLKVAHRLLDAVRNLQIPHEFSDAAKHVTMSMGVSTVAPPVKVSASVLIETADKALYEAKAMGRNQVKFLALNNPI